MSTLSEKMIHGPGLFSNIGNKARDLLLRDYNSDQKFTVSTYSGAGVALTSSAVKRGGFSTGDVATQYKYKNSVIDVKVDTESIISTTLTCTEILPCTRTIASFRFPDYNSGKLEVQYFHEFATLTGAVALNQSPTIDASVTVGNCLYGLGAEASYETTTGDLTKYTGGLTMTNKDSCASLIIGDKGDTLRASYVHKLKRSTAVGEFSRKLSTNDNTFTVGGSFAIDSLTSVKAKLNNHGKLGAVFQHEIIPKSLLTISGDVDTKALDKTPRFGLSLALRP